MSLLYKAETRKLNMELITEILTIFYGNVAPFEDDGVFTDEACTQADNVYKFLELLETVYLDKPLQYATEDLKETIEEFSWPQRF